MEEIEKKVDTMIGESTMSEYKILQELGEAQEKN
jgi:hypothetical protein